MRGIDEVLLSSFEAKSLAACLDKQGVRNAYRRASQNAGQLKLWCEDYAFDVSDAALGFVFRFTDMPETFLLRQPI
jgi:hypothetical protein